MDRNFGAWLRPAMTDIDEEYLTKRWAAIEAISEDLDFSEVTRLIKYFCRAGSPDEELVSKVRNAFWEKDSAFAMTGNELELRQLCGALVIHILRSDKLDSATIALMVVIQNAFGLHPDIGKHAVVEEAETILEHASYSMRNTDPVPKIPQRIISAANLWKPIKEHVDAGQWPQGFALLENTLAEYAKVCNRLAANGSSLRSATELQKEEIDILWWLIGAYSDDLQKPYSKIDKGPASIVAGKELASLISHRPGPIGISEIVGRMIANASGKNSKITLANLVTKLPIDWRRTLTKRVDVFSGLLCPLLFAIAKSAELDDDSSWQKLFENQFPHSLSESQLPEIWGVQMCRECLLLDDIADWE